MFDHRNNSALCGTAERIGRMAADAAASARSAADANQTAAEFRRNGNYTAATAWAHVAHSTARDGRDAMERAGVALGEFFDNE